MVSVMSQQTFLVKGQTVNIIGFASKKKNWAQYVGTYIMSEQISTKFLLTKFSVRVITESNVFHHTGLLMRRMEFFS